MGHTFKHSSLRTRGIHICCAAFGSGTVIDSLIILVMSRPGFEHQNYCIRCERSNRLLIDFWLSGILCSISSPKSKFIFYDFMLCIKPCQTQIHSLVGIYAIIKFYALIESLSPTFATGGFRGGRGGGGGAAPPPPPPPPPPHPHLPLSSSGRTKL